MSAAAALAGCVFAATAARAAEPITIGFGMALTGGLAAAGKTALLAMQIWQDDVNAKEGLLGRPVKLVYYDDQTNPPSRNNDPSEAIHSKASPYPPGRQDMVGLFGSDPWWSDIHHSGGGQLPFKHVY